MILAAASMANRAMNAAVMWSGFEPSADPRLSPASALFWSVRVRLMTVRVSNRVCEGFAEKCDYD